MTMTVETTPETVTRADAIAFTDDTAAFKRIYRASRATWREGSNPLTGFFETTPDGSFTRGRKFGIEIEFDNDMEPITEGECECMCVCSENCDGECNSGCGGECNSDSEDDDSTTEFECECECRCWEYCDGECFEYSCECSNGRWSSMSEWMCNEGMLGSNLASEYHAGAGNYDNWRYEADCTVTGGEVITPIMEDNGASWERISEVMDKIREFGGYAYSEKCGGHISINVPELRDNERRQMRLFTLVQKFEDVMFRLATNPERAQQKALNYSLVEASRHRGLDYTPTVGLVGEFSEVYLRHLRQGRWLNYAPYDNRLEFRIFDGSLDAATSQTYAMIAAAFVDAAQREDIDEALAALPNRLYGWHVAQRVEAGFKARTALSGDAWEKDTLAIRQFVDLLFDNTQDKERVITLFAGNDWCKVHAFR